MKNVYRISTKQYGNMKSGISRSKKPWCIVLLKGVKVKLSPLVCKSDRFGRFVVAMVKLQQFVISEADKVHH